MTDPWKIELREAITQPETLCELLELDPQWLKEAIVGSELFPLRVPRSFLQRIEKNNINDPLLKQILPLQAEHSLTPGFNRDPLNEQAYNPIPGLLHKYHGRVLLTLTSSCAVNCRYCFRRYFPYEDNNPGRQGWQQAIDYIQEREDIFEVILSGGDPLMATDQQLTELITALDAIPHLSTLRIHSRIPIFLPSRLTDNLIEILENSRLQAVMVTHCNHANEINADVAMAIAKLAKKNISLLNQTVLLKGVNDNAKALIELSKRLFELNILPYYLHCLDKVQGTAHFYIDDQRAKQLHQAMLESLPGYLVPRLVREVAGVKHKQGF